MTPCLELCWNAPASNLHLDGATLRTPAFSPLAYILFVFWLGFQAQFFNLPNILARFGPRCSDDSLPVRQFAIQGIKAALKTAMLYDGELGLIICAIDFSKCLSVP